VSEIQQSVAELLMI